MALYDNRVFKAANKWWVAEVHGASGAGFTDQPRIMHETVIFTCLSDDQQKSLSAILPVRQLRAIDHESLLAVLNNADAFTEYRLPLRPTNAPDAEELSSAPLVIDRTGLSWRLLETKQLRITPNGIVEGRALDVICMDDSAMRRLVVIDQDQYDEEEVVDRVKSSFMPYHVTPKVAPMTRYYRWKPGATIRPPLGVESGRCYAVERYQDERGTKLTLNLIAEDGRIVAKDVPRYFLEECIPVTSA